MRHELARTLINLAKDSKNIIFLTGDLGFGIFDEYKNRFPNQYYNVGISESALVAIAAGLSKVGYIPVIYSIASFMTARPFEQIRFLVGYNNLPTIIIGAGGGISYGMSGASHMAIDDLGLMALIPGLRVAAPAGPTELREILNEAVLNRKSTYIQIGKFEENDLKNQKIISGSKLLIFSTGLVSHEVAKAHKILLEINIKVDYIHLSFPFEIESQISSINLNQYSNILVVEDHIPQGGLYSSVLSVLNSKNIQIPTFRLGLPDEFIYEFLDSPEIRKKYNYDLLSIVEFVRNLNI